MDRNTTTRSLPPVAGPAGVQPVWLPTWAVGCCVVPLPAMMWMLQMSQQFHVAYQQGLEAGQRQAAAMYANSLAAPSSN